MSRVLFFIQEGLRAMRRSAAPSIAAVVTIVVTVVLLGVLIPILQGAQEKTNEVRDQLELRAFIYDDATTGEIDALHARILEIPHVAETEFVSKREAVPILKERLEDDDILHELPGNPLPASFTIRVDDADNLESVRAALTPPDASGDPRPISPVLEEVRGSRDEAESILKVTGALKIILMVIAILLLIASLLLIANTIRLSIYARRREVEVMRLVGATNWFIRWPFMVEGLVVGFIGGVAAIGILALGKMTIVDPLADSFALVEGLNTIDFVPLMIVLLATAITVSVLGSGLTLRRFLRV